MYTLYCIAVHHSILRDEPHALFARILFDLPVYVDACEIGELHEPY